MLAAADRDPGKYPCPHDFALERRALRDHVLPILREWPPMTTIATAYSSFFFEARVNRVMLLSELTSSIAHEGSLASSIRLSPSRTTA